LKANASVTDVSFRAALSIVKVLNADVDVATDNTAQSSVCSITSTGSATHQTIVLSTSGRWHRLRGYYELIADKDDDCLVGRTHRTQFTAHLEIQVRNVIGDAQIWDGRIRPGGPSAMITMETPFRPSWRRHRRAVPTTTIYRVTDRRQERLRSRAR
jgi:hypothetical protein